MPLIRVSYAAKHSQEVKDSLMQELTQVYAKTTGGDPRKVWVILEEVDASDWATAGVSLSSRK